MGRAIVNFAGKDAVHGLSMSRHLLVRVEVYSEATMALFDSGALPKVDEETTPPFATNELVYQSCELCSEKFVGTLNEVPTSSGELVVPINILVLEETGTISLSACQF